MSKNEEICGTCISHRNEDGEWICNNPDSECFGCYTEYRDTCNSWDERQPRQKFNVNIKHKNFL